jgi:ABC-type glycerol-3-phosphate transport system substrate-binding protein
MAINKKSWVVRSVALVVFLLLSQLLFAGGQGATEGATQQQGEQVIRFVCSGGGSGRALAGGVEQFNEKYKGKYRVEVDQIGYEAIFEKAMSQFISKSVSYDVFGLADVWIPALGQYMEPLESRLDRSFNPVELYGQGVADGGKANGNLVALPIRIGVYILYYRKDMLEEVGLKLPTSFDEIITAAEKLTKRDTNPANTRYGIALQFQSESWTPKVFASVFQMYGGRILNPTNTGPDESLKGPAAIKALDFFRSLQDKNLIPPAMSWTYDDNILAFQTSRLALALEFSSRALTLEKPGTDAIGKMGYMPFPGEKLGPYSPAAYHGLWYIGMDKNSRYKEGATEFMKFITSLEIQKYMAIKWANGPTILSIYDDPDYIKTDPAAQAVKDVLKNVGTATYPAIQAPEIEVVIHEEVQKLFMGNSSRQTAEAIYNRIAQVMK